MQPITINIITGAVIMIASFVVGLRLLFINNRLEVKILAWSWIIAGLVFLANTLPDLLYHQKLLSILTTHFLFHLNVLLVLFFAIAVYFYAFVVLLGHKKVVYILLFLPIALGVFMFIDTNFNSWGDIIYSEWGIEMQPPYYTRIIFFVLTGFGVLLTILVALKEIINKLRGRIFNTSKFLAVLSIIIYALFGTIDAQGYYTEWKMVFVRMFMLVGVLISLFIYSNKRKIAIENNEEYENTTNSQSIKGWLLSVD